MQRQSRNPALSAVVGFAAVTLFATVGNAQDNIAGTYRVSSDRTTVEIPEWGSDCGPRPEAHTGAAGRPATIAYDGSQATIQDGRHRYRTDGCWSDNPHVRRLSATHSGSRWTIVCQTPDSDYQHEQGTFTVTADGTHVNMHETTEYSWQLRESRCRATASRTLTYDRTGDAPDSGAVTQVARDAGPATQPPPPRENRCANPGAPARLDVSPARRSLAPGGRTCFRARVLDPNGCEVPGTASGISWAISRNGGTAGGNDATLDGACVRAPAGSPQAEYAIAVTAGGLSARALAAVVTVEELRSLVAQHIEDDPADTVTPTQTGTASGTGLGAVVVHVPVAPSGSSGSGLLLWLLLGTGVLLAVGGVILLTRKRSRPSVVPGERVSMAPDPSALSGRQRREAVAISARELPFANGIVAPPSSQPSAAATAGSRGGAVDPNARTVASDSPAVAGAVVAVQPEVASARPLDKQCPKCGLRFTAENAFCPEDGSTLVAAGPGPAVAPTAVIASATTQLAGSGKLAPICPTCGKPVEGGVRFCPIDGTAMSEGALPLRCPKCNKQFAIGTAFCGEDGSSLVRAG